MAVALTRDTVSGTLGPADQKEKRQVETTSSVSLAEVRQRTSLELIEETVRQIVESFWPEQIILFGSYASGQPRPESDVDLLVVIETSLREAEQAARICQGIDYHFALDLIVRTPATLARRLSLGNPFLLEVTQKGRVLYERPGR